MVTEARLRCYVSDESMFQYYFGDFEIGRKYNSPLRKDPKPSFQITEKGGALLWFDFGLGKKVRPDGLGFVQELFDVSREEAVKIVWNDFVTLRVTLPKKKRSLNISLPYDLYQHALTQKELEYWQRHCIELPLLERFQVAGLEGLYRHGDLVWKSTDTEPAYVYNFSKDVFKVYRPLSEDRFRGQNNGLTIEGYDQLPRSGSRLFISSSLKDSIVLTSLGYNSCNPPGETNIKALFSKASEFNQRFDEVIVFFDNDKPGIAAAGRVAKETGWKSIVLPKNLAKDPSDVIKKFGNRFVLSETLRNLAP